MPQRLPRFSRTEAALEDRAKIQRILDMVAATGASDASSTPATRSASGHDWRRRRGVPFHARGIPGAIAGTDPLRTLLEREARGELRL